jgi:hypothetical protein
MTRCCRFRTAGALLARNRGRPRPGRTRGAAAEVKLGHAGFFAVLVIAQRHLLAGTWDRERCLDGQPKAWSVVPVPERHITVKRPMAAPIRSVWTLFSDFPNLVNHWTGLRETRAIGDQTRGVGARRHVALKPIGSMEETVTLWEEGRRLDTENRPSLSVPFGRAASTLTLEPDGDGTLATFDYRFVPRGGPVGRVTGPVIERMLTRSFDEMLAVIESAALGMGGER